MKQSSFPFDKNGNSAIFMSMTHHITMMSMMI